MNEIIKKNGITFGIISGLISIFIETVIYVVDQKLFISWWLGLLGISISVVLACILLTKTKKDLSNNLTFKEAFTTYFIMALVGTSLFTTFAIILFNVIDPSLKVSVKELTIKAMSEMMKNFGADKAAMSAALKTIQETDQFGVLQQIKGLFTSLVMSSILGLILAAFFKTPTRQEI